MPLGTFKRPRKAVCQNCGKIFNKWRGNQKYCSDRCRLQAIYQRQYQKKGRVCRWCGEKFKVTFKNHSRQHCYKPECEKRQWLWQFLYLYKRCFSKDCDNILVRGKTKFQTFHYCPFCSVMPRSLREEYVKWTRSLPNYVEVFLPKRNVPIKNFKQYVKEYDVNSLRFQVYYPHNNSKVGEKA